MAIVQYWVAGALSGRSSSPPLFRNRLTSVSCPFGNAPPDSDGARYTARSDLTVIAPFVEPVRHVIAGWPEVEVRRLRVGERHDLALVAEYEDGSRSEPLVAQWSSSRSHVALVNAVGMLETLASGTFRVTATAPAAVVTSPSWSVSQGANRPPLVTAECRPCDVSVGNGVHLSASNASDPDGDALTVEWSVPAGVVRYPQRFETDSFLPEHAGSFTATVVVTDPYGLTHSDFVTVYVTAPGSPAAACCSYTSVCSRICCGSLSRDSTVSLRSSRNSLPIPFAPVSAAATSVVPVPANGSRTVSPFSIPASSRQRRGISSANACVRRQFTGGWMIHTSGAGSFSISAGWYR